MLGCRACHTPRVGTRSQGTAGGWSGHVWAVVLVAVATVAALLVDAWFAPPDVALLFVAAIMASAAWHGRGPSILAAAASVAAFDFFLVSPRLTFDVAEPRYILTFAMMFGVGLVISGLMSRLRRQGLETSAREAKTASLYAVGRALAIAQAEADIVEVLVDEARRVFGAQAQFIDVRGREVVATMPPAHARAVREASTGGITTGDAGLVAVPLLAGDAVQGVLLLTGVESSSAALDLEFLESFARQGGTVIARGRAAAEAALADRRARAEEVRATLLSAVSHDLRTPLAVISGAASTLREGPLDAAQRDELLATVCDEAERLERLVGNLLDMTRLQGGAVVLRTQWLPLEEVVGSALLRLESRLGQRPVQVVLQPDLPLLWIDPVLIEQVLVNLLDNAIKYAPEQQPIELRSFVRDDQVVIQVLDRGPGLPPGLGARAFDKFVRGAAHGRDGFGLGLAICREIVGLHLGTIAAHARPGGGACIEIALPRSADEPAPVLGDAAVKESA